MSEPSPLILTLRLDGADFVRFDLERKRHFPPSRNLVPAHLTLFHHLPGGLHSEIAEDVLASARRFGPIRLKVSSMRFLGAGVAYDVTSGELATLRNELAQRWLQHLSQQDRQTFRPHITIQNKVHADTARTLYAQMTDSFEPFDITGTGLQVWRYRGGPWEAAGEYAFSAGSAELPR